MGRGGQTTFERFQESALLCRVDSDIRGPADLKGKRVGVRGYSQTTGLWLRGTLADDYGIAAESVEWVTFEDAHVAECRYPPFARRAKPGEVMLAMLRKEHVATIEQQAASGEPVIIGA